MKYLTLVFIIALSACYSKKPEKTSKQGQPLPDFAILLSDSNTILSTKDIPVGKPSVFFIFGPHCPYSKAQMQTIVANAKDTKGLEVIAITPYPFGLMKEFYKSYNIQDFPNIKMGVDTNNFFGTYIEAKAVPYIAIYDKNKKLSKAYLGITSFDEIKKAAFN